MPRREPARVYYSPRGKGRVTDVMHAIWIEMYLACVELLDGARVRAVGQSVAAGNKCYMKQGQIIQQAPNLPQSSMILY